MGSVTKDGIYQIMVSRGGLSVLANAGAKVSINVNNQWVNVLQALGFSGDGPDGTIGRVINGFQIFSGNNFLPKILTSHVWRGSNGLELSIQLRFDAWDDARRDVLMPIQKLVRMFMPKREGGGGGGNLWSSVTNIVGNQFLSPPGPTPFQVLQGSWKAEAATLIIGKVWHFDDLIPTTLALEFEDRYTKEGDPVCGVVTLGFMSFMTPDQNDVIGYFQAGEVA